MIQNPKHINLQAIQEELLTIKDSLSSMSWTKKSAIDILSNSFNNEEKSMETMLTEIKTALTRTRWGGQKNTTTSFIMFNWWCLKNQLVDNSIEGKCEQLKFILEEIQADLFYKMKSNEKRENIQALLNIISSLQNVNEDPMALTKIQASIVSFKTLPLDFDFGDAVVSRELLFKELVKVSQHILNIPRSKKEPTVGKTTASLLKFNEWYTTLEQCFTLRSDDKELNKTNYGYSSDDDEFEEKKGSPKQVEQHSNELKISFSPYGDSSRSNSSNSSNSSLWKPVDSTTSNTENVFSPTGHIPDSSTKIRLSS